MDLLSPKSLPSAALCWGVIQSLRVSVSYSQILDNRQHAAVGFPWDAAMFVFPVYVIGVPRLWKHLISHNICAAGLGTPPLLCAYSSILSVRSDTIVGSTSVQDTPSFWFYSGIWLARARGDTKTVIERYSGRHNFSKCKHVLLNKTSCTHNDFFPPLEQRSKCSLRTRLKQHFVCMFMLLTCMCSIGQNIHLFSVNAQLAFMLRDNTHRAMQKLVRCSLWTCRVLL